MLNKLIDYAEDYIKGLDIVDFGIIKICLIAFGVMMGASVSQRNKKGVMIGAGIIFVAAFMWVMMKFLGVDCCCCNKDFDEYDIDEDYDWAE